MCTQKPLGKPRNPRAAHLVRAIGCAAVGLVASFAAVTPSAAAPVDPVPLPLGEIATDASAEVGEAIQGVVSLAPGAAEDLRSFIPEPPFGLQLPGDVGAVAGDASESARESELAPAASGQAIEPARRLVSTRDLEPTGLRAVLTLTRSATALLLLSLAAAIFLAFESTFGRHNPRLAAAPVDRRDVELEFN